MLPLGGTLQWEARGCHGYSVFHDGCEQRKADQPIGRLKAARTSAIHFLPSNRDGHRHGRTSLPLNEDSPVRRVHHRFCNVRRDHDKAIVESLLHLSRAIYWFVSFSAPMGVLGGVRVNWHSCGSPPSPPWTPLCNWNATGLTLGSRRAKTRLGQLNMHERGAIGTYCLPGANAGGARIRREAYAKRNTP
jgi:hypothetical protein